MSTYTEKLVDFEIAVRVPPSLPAAISSRIRVPLGRERVSRVNLPSKQGSTPSRPRLLRSLFTRFSDGCQPSPETRSTSARVRTETLSTIRSTEKRIVNWPDPVRPGNTLWAPCRCSSCASSSVSCHTPGPECGQPPRRTCIRPCSRVPKDMYEEASYLQKVIWESAGTKKFQLPLVIGHHNASHMIGSMWLRNT